MGKNLWEICAKPEKNKRKKGDSPNVSPKTPLRAIIGNGENGKKGGRLGNQEVLTGDVVPARGGSKRSKAAVNSKRKRP